MPKRNRLRMSRIDEVSLVDKGDNPTADVVIHKRAPESNVPTPTPAPSLSARIVAAVAKLMNKPADEVQKAYDEAATYDEVVAERSHWRIESEVYQRTSDLADAICRTLRDKDAADPSATILQSVQQFAEAIDDALEHWTEGETVEKSAPDDNAALTRLTAARDTLSAHIAEVNKQTGSEPMPEATKETNTPPAPNADDVLKSASPEVQKMFADLNAKVEKAEKQAQDAENVAKAEREARETAELRKRAETELSHLTGTVEEKTDLLREMKKSLSPEAFEKAVNVMKAASAAVGESALFTETGSGGAGSENTALGKVEQMAKALVEKGEYKTMPEAIAKVANDNPELYEQYRAGK